MYGKKKLILWAAVFALALPLLLANNAYAIYAGDGTKPNASGTWDLTDYGKCVYGIDSSGNITTGAETSRAACIATLFTDPTNSTSAGCTSFTNNEGTSHYWQSTCVSAGNTGISLDGLDRTSTNCTLKGGTWKSFCSASWVYTGPNNDGVGFENGGFCYTTIDVTADYGSQPACPTGTSGYSWNALLNGGSCIFSYGISGTLGTNSSNAWTDLKKKDSSVYVSAHTAVDLSSLTQGQCLANGGSWSTGAIKSSTTTLGSGAVVANMANTRAGCLECHNSTSQNNGYAERWKDKYILTGHKNMLRKVAQDGSSTWKGPDADGILQTYTAAAEGNINMSSTPPTADVSEGAGKTLLYIFGDWMATAPAGLDVIVDVGGYGKYNGGSNYSCAACHTSGWSNPTAGICDKSSLTSEATCTNGGGVWTWSGGVQGTSYVAGQPALSFPTITFTGAGMWDRDGILCSRCHQSVFAPSTGQTAMQVNSGVTSTYVWVNAAIPGTSSHNVTPASTSNEQVNNICFGCHQGSVKTNNGAGADVDLSDATLVGVKNTATAPAYVPEFSGHVLGAEFLNSPHSRFTGTLTPNALGKYDLSVNTPANYNSTFKGYLCRSSSSAGGGSILSTVWKNGAVTEIKSQDDCNLANNKASGTVGYWQTENQGSCTTCHDIHQSLFVVGQEGLKKECETCHEDTSGTGGTGYAAIVPQIEGALLNHPTGTNTPFDSAKFANACEACHMPRATSGGFPVHLWRINTAATYSTFPSAEEFSIATGGTGTNQVVKRADDDHGYSAMWVDVDLACGQCHETTGLNYTSGIPVFTKDELAGAAMGLHSGGTITTDPAVANPLCLACHATGVGGAPVITPGTNHHGQHIACTACHTNGHNGPLPDKHDNTFCLTCHTNTGPYAVHHATANVPAECVLCHAIPGVTVPEASSGNCRGCHGSSFTATTGQTVRAVIQGTNHHNGNCLTCHKAEPFALLATGDLSSTGTYSALTPMSNVITGSTTTSTTSSSYQKWTMDRTSLMNFCTSCHSVAQTKSAGGTLPAITPSGANDNHHQGHAILPGQGGGEPNDPGLSCVGCHGAGALSGALGPWVSGATASVTWSIAASGLPTATVSAQKGFTGGADATSSLCKACHDIIQSGATQNHHAGVCGTCHKYDGTWSGTYPAGVGSGSNVLLTMATNSRDSVTTYCQHCHVNPATRSADSTAIRAIVPSGTGDNHHRGSGTTTARTVAGCLYCHGEVGGLPFGSAEAENMVQQSPSAPMSCNGACHSSTLPTSGQHHTGAGLTPTKGFLCLTCHNPADPTALQPGVATTPPNWTDCSACHTSGGPKGPSASHHAVATGVTCEECHTYAGQKPAAVVLSLQTNSRDSATNYCQQCHVAAQVYSNGTSTITVRAIVPSGTGDNHHRGSGTSTARIVAGCLYCHANPTTKEPGLPFGDATTEVMQDAVTLGNAGSCSGACHASAQASSGTHHTGTNAQGSTVTLTNNTKCLTCHNPADPNAMWPGVAVTPAGWADCTACHPGTVGGIASGPSATHHLSTSCEACHATAGIRPATTGSNCQGCHGQTINAVITMMAINSCTTCHTQGGSLPAATYCQGCHDGTTASTWADSKMAMVHKAIPTAAFTAVSDLKINFKVNYTVGTIICPSGPGTCTYGWDFGDLTSSNSGTAKTTSHTFASAGTYTTTLTVTSGNLNGQKSVSHAAKAIQRTSIGPIVINLLPKTTATGYTVTIPSLSGVITGGVGTVTFKISWGDGKVTPLMTRGVGPDSISHVYPKATIGLVLPYNLVVSASDSPALFKSVKSAASKVTVRPYYIAGDVMDKSGTRLAGATVQLKQGTTIRLSAKSNVIGQYVLSNVRPELVTGATTSNTPYTISVLKTGYTFTSFTFGAVIDPASTTQIIIKDMMAK